MIQVPHWTPLSYTFATLGSKCGILRPCPLLPSRRPLSLLLLWLCLGSLLVGTFLLFMHSPLHSLRRETSGAKIVARVFFSFVWCAFVVCGCCLSGKEKAVLTKVTKDWTLLASPRAPVFAPLPLALPSSGGGFYLNSFVSSEFVLGVLCPVALQGRSCLSERGGR